MNIENALYKFIIIIIIITSPRLKRVLSLKTLPFFSIIRSWKFYLIWTLIMPGERLGVNCDRIFRKLRVGGGGGANGTDISRNLIPNFGCTARDLPKVPGNRNNQVFPFQSTIPARAQFLRARKSKSTWLWSGSFLSDRRLMCENSCKLHVMWAWPRQWTACLLNSRTRFKR